MQHIYTQTLSEEVDAIGTASYPPAGRDDPGMRRQRFQMFAKRFCDLVGDRIECQILTCP